MQEPYQKIAEFCCCRILAQKKRPLLVAITGESGSGKSFYSQLIRQQLDAKGVKYTYIDADDFLIPRKDRGPMKHRFYRSGQFKGKSYWEVLENMFYLDKMQRVIDDLRQGQPSSYYPYTRETGAVVEQKKTVHPAEIVIFDTMMLFDQMDWVIVVEVSRENILKRKIQRDSDIRTETEIVQMHQQVQGAYWDRCRPQNPDIVIDNNDFNYPKIRET